MTPHEIIMQKTIELWQSQFGMDIEIEVSISKAKDSIVKTHTDSDTLSKKFGENRLHVFSAEHLPFPIEPKHDFGTTEVALGALCNHPHILRQDESETGFYCDKCGRYITH